MVGDKRSAAEFEENSDLRPKRVKMRDLESVFRSEGKSFFSFHEFSSSFFWFFVMFGSDCLPSNDTPFDMGRFEIS